MNINMASKQFDELVRLCKSSKIEQSGVLDVSVENEEVYVTGITLDQNDLVKSSNSKRIVYNNEKFVVSLVYGLGLTSDGVYIRFHTHPSFGGIPKLSKQDIETLRYTQGVARRVGDKKGININVVEAVVTNSEVAFYHYDLEAEKAMRIPLFVDGLERVPITEKSKFQIFKEAFAEGRKQARK